MHLHLSACLISSEFILQSRWGKVLYIDRQNCVLYAFDMTVDLGKDDHFCLLRQGSVHLTLKFQLALQATMTIIVFTELKDVIEIVREPRLLLANTDPIS